MVKEGTSDLENVMVVKSGRQISFMQLIYSMKRYKAFGEINDYINYDYYALGANIEERFYGIKQTVNQLISDTDSEVIFYCLSQSGFDDIVVRYQKFRNKNSLYGEFSAI